MTVLATMFQLPVSIVITPNASWNHLLLALTFNIRMAHLGTIPVFNQIKQIDKLPIVV